MRYPLYSMTCIAFPMPGPGWRQVADATNHRARLPPWLASPPQLTAYPKDDSSCHSAAIASMLGCFDREASGAEARCRY